MNAIYSPKNVNQIYFLLIYPCGVYLLTELNLEKQQPMFMGKDRIKLEAILKAIKKTSDVQQAKNTGLAVFELTDTGIKPKLQSIFYNIIPAV